MFDLFSLPFSIVNRGKLLHSAMNSLHNFDRSIDKFLAWLSETESSLEGLEADVDRLGSRRDPAALRQHLPQLKVSPSFAISLVWNTISPRRRFFSFS